MVEKEKLNKLIWRLLRGFQEGFSDCRTIREGLSYKRIIPKSFWDNPEYGYLEIFGRFNLKKWELREIHKEVIERIIHEINHPSEKEMYADNYARLFHALSILGVPKSDTRVPAIGKITCTTLPIPFGLWTMVLKTPTNLFPMQHGTLLKHSNPTSLLTKIW